MALATTRTGRYGAVWTLRFCVKKFKAVVALDKLNFVHGKLEWLGISMIIKLKFN